MKLKRIMVALAMVAAVSVVTVGVWTFTGHSAVAGCSSGC
jgi:hypothetical protein